MLCLFFFFFHHAWGLQLPHSFIIICVMNFYGHVSLAFMVLRVPREYFRSSKFLAMSMSWKNCSSFKFIDWNFFLPSQFTCPGHCCALWHQFHRNFSLFDASAWKNIPQRPYFHFLSHSLLTLLRHWLPPSSFSSYSDAFCVVHILTMHGMMEVIIMNDTNQI